MGTYHQSMPGRTGEFTNNMTRVAIIPYKLLAQNLSARDVSFIEVGEAKGDYSFLVGESLFEQFTHNWESFENMAGRLGQVAQHYHTLAKDAKASTAAVFGGKGGYEPTKFKIDTPYMFASSDRRKFNLTINLRDQDDPGKIMNVVTDFKQFSAAKIGENAEALSKINFPYVFRVYTIPQNFIFYEFAALQSIQVTYNDFVGGTGLPAAIDMILEFADMYPLYDRTFAKNTATVTTG